MKKTDPPAIACSLDAASLAARRGELKQVLGAARVIEQTATRVRFAFAAPRAEDTQAVLELVLAERECCPFLGFELNFEPGLGALTVTISAPPGSAELLNFFAGEDAG